MVGKAFSYEAHLLCPTPAERCTDGGSSGDRARHGSGLKTDIDYSAIIRRIRVPRQLKLRRADQLLKVEELVSLGHSIRLPGTRIF